jgi:hypothetical protein
MSKELNENIDDIDGRVEYFLQVINKIAAS